MPRRLPERFAGAALPALPQADPRRTPADRCRRSPCTRCFS